MSSPIKDLLYYLKPFKRRFILTVLLSMFITIVNLVPAQVIRYILNKALPERNVRFIIEAVGLLTIFYLVRSLIVYFRTRILNPMAQGIASRLRRDTFFHAQRLSLSFFDSARVGKLLSRIVSDTIHIQRFFTTGSHIFIVSVLTFIGVLILTICMNWKLTLFAILPIPFLIFLTFRYGRIIRGLYRALRVHWGSLSAQISDSLSGIKEVKSFTQEGYEEGRFTRENNKIYSTEVRAADVSALYDPAILFVHSAGYILVIGLGSWLCLNGRMQTGDLVAFLLYLGLLYQPITQLNALVMLWERTRAASDHISEITKLPVEIYEDPHAIELARPLKGIVEFKDVSFSYVERKVVIKHISFKVEQGKNVAIVGATGAGKTSLISLIPRFYDPDDGAIYIDGTNIRSYKLKDLRKNIGIVLQDPFLFAGNIEENIRYGRPDASFKRVEESAKGANIYEFIRSLPDGYKTQVGERGVKISGGEKQRIAIARLLLKDPPIIIMDEATSSLDSNTEILVKKALERLMKGRTTFIIAHRLSTVENVDRILVIEEGELVETGTHQELLSRGGVYAKLYQAQFKNTAII